MSWTLAEILAATGGAAGAGMSVGQPVSGVSTDSRRAAAGSVYFALRGEHHDGHRFVSAVLEQGAVAAVVDRRLPEVDAARQIVVDDTLRALGDLAGWSRRIQPLTVIAITGSNGKTTTKELTAAICNAAHFPPPRPAVLKTEGNLNNLIGLPLTLLGRRGDEAVGVLEMGMNQPGEIGRLTEIARPDYATITNVGPAHLQGLGSLAGVAAAKGELFAGLPSTSTIAVNVDDEWVARLAASFGGAKILYGRGGDVRAENVAELGLDGLGFELRVGAARARVRLRLIGRHNVQNALAAAALTHAMGLSLETIVRGLESPVGPPMRMQSLRLANGVTLINDAYNSNPASVEAALETLQRLPGRSVAVLGDMWELGDESRHAHRSIGERAGALGVDRLILVGAMATAMAEGAMASGLAAERIAICEDHRAAADSIRADWRAGDVVLIKGSRGMKMEEVVRLLEDAGNPS